MFSHPIRMIDTPINEATKHKWQIGQEKYGVEFVGNPIEQLDFELLDAMNYSDEMDRQGMGIPGLREKLYALCSDIREHYRSLRGINV